MSVISDFRHTVKIRRLFAEKNGTRLCFIDEQSDVFIYSPVDDSLTAIPNTGPSVQVSK